MYLNSLPTSSLFFWPHSTEMSNEQAIDFVAVFTCSASAGQCLLRVVVVIVVVVVVVLVLVGKKFKSP